MILNIKNATGRAFHAASFGILHALKHFSIDIDRKMSENFFFIPSLLFPIDMHSDSITEFESH